MRFKRRSGASCWPYHAAAERDGDHRVGIVLDVATVQTTQVALIRLLFRSRILLLLLQHPEAGQRIVVDEGGVLPQHQMQLSPKHFEIVLRMWVPDLIAHVAIGSRHGEGRGRFYRNVGNIRKCSSRQGDEL